MTPTAQTVVEAAQRTSEAWLRRSPPATTRYPRAPAPICSQVPDISGTGGDRLLDIPMAQWPCQKRWKKTWIFGVEKPFSEAGAASKHSVLCLLGFGVGYVS